MMKAKFRPAWVHYRALLVQQKQWLENKLNETKREIEGIDDSFKTIDKPEKIFDDE